MIPIARSSSTATASPSAAGARRGAPPVRRPACRPAASTSAGAAARTLIRASVPERVAMLLTGHKIRAIFDRYNIIHERELRSRAGDQLVEYLARLASTIRSPRPRLAPTTRNARRRPKRTSRRKISDRSGRLPSHGVSARNFCSAPASPEPARSRRYASDAIHDVTIFWKGMSFMNLTKISSF